MTVYKILHTRLQLSSPTTLDREIDSLNYRPIFFFVAFTTS